MGSTDKKQSLACIPTSEVRAAYRRHGILHLKDRILDLLDAGIRFAHRLRRHLLESERQRLRRSAKEGD
jgi:hypothetical protein